MENAQLYPMLEAVLFAAGYPVPYERLGELAEMSTDEIKEAVSTLHEKYQSEDFGIQIVLFENECQMCTKEVYEGYVRDALGIKQNGKLSNSSLEVLAIVAYHQPVTRSQIEHIRGVDSSYAVNSLVTKKLIEEKGRLEVPGRPVLFGTTLDFLRCFGLSSLADLPDASVFMENTQTELDLSPAPDEGETFTDSADGTDSEKPEA